MRLSAAMGAATLALIAAGPVVAQDALAAEGVLRVAAVGQTRVMMVQGVAADPFVWEWSFFDEDIEEDEPFDTSAISVMYDCAAWTRRPLVQESYRDGQFVNQTPLYEEPAQITPGTLADGAAQVVCQPEANSDGAVFPDMASARAAMDARKSPPPATANP